MARRARAIVVLVTCPTRRSARRIATALVRQRLAACVSVLPAVESTFWWKASVDHAREVLLFIKTTSPRFERLRRGIVAIHPYDVPEIIALPIIHSHTPYLRWVLANLEGGAERTRSN